MEWQLIRKIDFYPFDTFLACEGYKRCYKHKAAVSFENLFFYFSNGCVYSFRGKRDMALLKDMLEKEFDGDFVKEFGRTIRERAEKLYVVTITTFKDKEALLLNFDAFSSTFVDLFSVFQLPDYAQLLLSGKDEKLLWQFGLDRDYAARIFTQVEAIYRKMLGELLCLPRNTALLLLPCEVESALQRNKYPQDLHKRTTCAIITIEGKTRVLWNEDADALFNTVHHKKEDRAKKHESKGQVVHSIPHNIRGITHLALNEDDFRNIPQGAILVCPMLRYGSLQYILDKVAAVVTDQGGITCHAAIIARETGIPAIVGTTEATDVLRSGDMVELDLSKGIVRKIF